jgi:hypothetical protein
MKTLEVLLVGAIAVSVVNACFLPLMEWVHRQLIWLSTMWYEDRDLLRSEWRQDVERLVAENRDKGYRPSEVAWYLLWNAMCGAPDYLSRFLVGAVARWSVPRWLNSFCTPRAMWRILWAGFVVYALGFVDLLLVFNTFDLTSALGWLIFAWSIWNWRVVRGHSV